VGDSLLLTYHDVEWGVPVHDDRRLFEFLILEGAQAGLSWLTILRRRDTYRAAFHGFDPDAVASMTDADVERLLRDPGIIRNRQKVTSTIANARCVLDVRRAHGSLDAYLWGLVGGGPLDSRLGEQERPADSTPTSLALSRALRTRDFSFVGPTICYAFMQAVGMVNDHTLSCFRHDEVMGDG
jgi:DNA-3-methyladenine glycosylase I